MADFVAARAALLRLFDGAHPRNARLFLRAKIDGIVEHRNCEQRDEERNHEESAHSYGYALACVLLLRCDACSLVVPWFDYNLFMRANAAM